MRVFKIIFCLLPLFSCLNAQSTKDNEIIKASIVKLFDGMRANDSMAIIPLFVKAALLESVYTDKEGKVVKTSTPISKFITSVGTPHSDLWDEVIWSYDIKIDMPLASAWTEYTFYRGGKISHCGVNVFEFLKVNGVWRISGITDTRRLSGCKTRSSQEVNHLMEAWHQAASVADDELFFSSMTADGVYIGTDPKERWTRDELKVWSAPYFKRDTAWNLMPLSRNVAFSPDESIGWFDEMLDSWMGLCRASGVVVRTKEGWKIKHYHLSIAVPNDVTPDYLKLIGKEMPKRE